MRPFLLSLLLLATPALAQPSVTLGSRTGMIAEPFNDVLSMAEYRDGRVIVADRISSEFVLADFNNGARKALGRQGAGPNEYQMPGGVARWRGDTLIGYDPFGHRVLRFAPGGVLAGTLPYPSLTQGRGFGGARAMDRAGRLYHDTPVIERPVIKRSKTAVIMRWRPGTDSMEQVGEYGDHNDFDHQYRYTAFPERDVWVLDADDRIGIISATEYRLRWYRDGKLVETGPPIPFTPVKVTAAERDAFRQKKAMEPVAGSASSSGQPARTSAVAGERAKAFWGDTLFPPTLPPFAERAALLAAGGDIWVRRLGPAGATSERIDILDAHGKLRAVLQLPPKRRLISLGASAVYLIATDEDGLQTLERYAYPSLPG